jgi:hypothetical protein
LAIKHGFNLERIYFNLMFLNIDNMDVAYDYIEKAVQVLETPTVVPENKQINSWQTYGNDERGIPDISNILTMIRYFYPEKMD